MEFQDDARLKNHTLAIYGRIQALQYPYPCIRHFTFLGLKISRHPSYQQFLNIGKEHQGANYADIGWK
ncbi:uncharacterized protein EV420DRAFT_346344 [Desarmillaria tabescens]|uniref:Uncharacterized protein n=1 Tax=Armillaria tabescens TaxID=1929756 RepID=A0AA39KDX1_ARMTA|nr:uncharacterized protein EV420DRAFT_346344 [Desarmillaria tabescens]KAK0459023.1 hypothetical protein EV420DRAFT_346344 [Desarmillaria tabescens]